MNLFFQSFEKSAASKWKGVFHKLAPASQKKLAPMEGSLVQKLRNRANANQFRLMEGTTGANVHQRGSHAQNMVSAQYPGVMDRPTIQKVVGEAEVELKKT